MTTPSLDTIKNDRSLVFEPATARAIAAQCNSASDRFADILGAAQSLKNSGSAGDFESAGTIQRSLSELAGTCVAAVDGLSRDATELGNAVRAAGQRIQARDEETAAALKSTSEKAGGYPAVGNESAGTVDCRSSDPIGRDDFLGRFHCDAKNETAPGGGVVDWGYANSSPADPVSLGALVKASMSVSRDIAATAEALATGIGRILADGSWSGTAADGVRAGSQNVVAIASSKAKNAFGNANLVAEWVADVLDTRTRFDGLKSQQEAEKFAFRTTVMASGLRPSVVQGHQRVMSTLDHLGRDVIDATYNPAAVRTSTGMLNLPDPGSPIGTLKPMGFARSAGGGGGASTASAMASQSGGVSNGGAADAARGRTGTDAAPPAPHQGAANGAGSKPDAAQSQQASVPSTTPSGMPKVGDGTSGSQSPTGAAPLTRSAGLGSVADAVKSRTKGGDLGKSGAGAGGARGGALGKLGGADGVVGAEGSLSGRSSSGVSAAERSAAAPITGPAAGRATPTSGTPMGGRGGHGDDKDKEHRAARYLVTAENGNEIAGDIPDTAPPVLGGLDMDTSDNPQPSPRP